MLWNKWRKRKNDRTVREYEQAYDKWYGELLRYTLNLFTWDGLPCEASVLEEYLFTRGCAGMVYDKTQGLIIVTGGLSGVTNYYPVFTHMAYATPLTSGVFKIGENGVICKANPLYLPDTDCVDSYANLLAHADLSIQAALINLRATNVVSVTNQAQADTVRTWLKGIRNGKTNTIMDKQDFESIIGGGKISVLPTYTHTQGILKELLEVRQNLLREFFAERGFLSDKSKTERLVTAEVNVNLYRAVYSIEDMLVERRKFANAANKMYNLNINVNYNEMLLKQISEIMEGGVTDGKDTDG